MITSAFSYFSVIQCNLAILVYFEIESECEHTNSQALVREGQFVSTISSCLKQLACSQFLQTKDKNQLPMDKNLTLQTHYNHLDVCTAQSTIIKLHSKFSMSIIMNITLIKLYTVVSNDSNASNAIHIMTNQML